MSKYDRKALSPSGLHYDGEQLTFKKYISKHTGREKKNGFVIFVLQKITIWQKTYSRQPEATSNVTFQYEGSWLIIIEQVKYK